LKVLGKEISCIEEEDIEHEFEAKPRTFDTLLDSNFEIIGKMVKEKSARSECNLSLRSLVSKLV